MGAGTRSKRRNYLIVGIALGVAVALTLFFLLKSGPEKRRESAEIEKEAERQIETLEGELTEPLDVKRADHFVSAETVLLKKDERIVPTTPRALLEDWSLDPQSEIKMLVEEETTVITTPRELWENRTIRPDAPVRVIGEDGQVRETTPAALMADEAITPDTPIKVIEKRERVIVTTPEKLMASLPRPDSPIRVVIEKPEEALTVAQLLPGEEDLGEDTFYVHTVTHDDVQGIWGIIQHGIMDQFLQGVPVSSPVGPSRERTLKLRIPENADETLRNGRSSYLGKLLHEKTKESYVYNYVDGRMGRNPDYISPGQEVVISRFTKRELVEIYKHFRKYR
jgi:hypothetical protein